MAARYHTTKVPNLQIVTVLQSHSTILPQSTACRLTQSTAGITVSASPHQPPTTTKPQTPPAKTHQRPRTTTHQEPQKKHIDPKAPKAHKATGKIKNRKDKNPLCYTSWVRIAQWLERWSCKPMVMGSIPGCGCTPSIPQSDNPQSATRIKDYFRRSQVVATQLKILVKMGLFPKYRGSHQNLWNLETTTSRGPKLIGLFLFDTPWSAHGQGEGRLRHRLPRFLRSPGDRRIVGRTQNTGKTSE